MRLSVKEQFPLFLFIFAFLIAVFFSLKYSLDSKTKSGVAGISIFQSNPVKNVSDDIYNPIYQRPGISISYSKAQSDVSPFTIHGYVYDRNRFGKKNIVVIFHEKSNFPGLSGSEVTNTDGYYSFADLDPGTYNPSIIVNGKLYEYKDKEVNINESKTIAQVDFILFEDEEPVEITPSPKKTTPAPTGVSPTISITPNISPTITPTIIISLTPAPSTRPSLTPTLTPTQTITVSPDPTTTTPPDEVLNFINTISENNIKEYLGNLVDNDDTTEKDENQTRYSTYGEENGNPKGNWVETEYAKKFFQNLGLETSSQNFTMSGKTTRNIIAKLKGENENDVYLITAHIDSTAARSGNNNPAPGADDNGSGSAAVMELARAFKTFNYQPKTSLMFVLFSGEEQGLVGSRYYVNNKPATENIKGVINLDMIGNKGSKECVNFYYKSYNGGDVISQEIVDVNQVYQIGLITTSRNIRDVNIGGSSDHQSFWDAGIPAIFGIECEFSPVYHTSSDKTDKINFSQITKTSKAVAATIYTMANE